MCTSHSDCVEKSTICVGDVCVCDNNHGMFKGECCKLHPWDSDTLISTLVLF